MGTHHTHPLSSFLSKLIDVRRPGKSFILDFPQTTNTFDPLDSFPEECYLSGLDETPFGTSEYYRAALGNIYGDSPFVQPPLKVVEL